MSSALYEPGRAVRVWDKGRYIDAWVILRVNRKYAGQDLDGYAVTFTKGRTDAAEWVCAIRVAPATGEVSGG